MAEGTSNSTASTPCSSLRKKALEDTATDAFKSVGSLTFRIDNFREFTERPAFKIKTSVRHCDAKVIVRGLTFELSVYPLRPSVLKTMGVIVKCENTSGCDVKGDGSWSCLASVTLQIKSLLESREDKIHKFTHKFFSSKKESSLEWENNPWFLNYLLNPKRGLYNEKDDTLELIAQISVDTPIGVLALPTTDATILVNGENVLINKHLLAAHSSYFHSLFYNGQFDEGKSGDYKVKIEAPATVEHFKRMLQTMYPENRPLDDECIEGVLHLANQFLVTIVEGKCLEFLREESKKPALFKYRMGDKYAQTALKDYVLEHLLTMDFKKKMFKANFTECVQLGPSALEAFMARYDQLFPPPESDAEKDE